LWEEWGGVWAGGDDAIKRRREGAGGQSHAAQRDPDYVLDRAAPPVYGYGPDLGRAALIACVGPLGLPTRRQARPAGLLPGAEAHRRAQVVALHCRVIG
jgi:hypothetical protein